jgi:hypothetical protein
VRKEADRFAVGGVDGDLDVGFLLRSVEDEAVSWLVNWVLGPLD